MLDLEVMRSADYRKNEDTYPCRSIHCEPCQICGKAVNTAKRYWMVHLHDGGITIVTEDEAEAKNAAGQGSWDVGGHAVGPECAKNPVLRPYLIRTEGRG